MKKIKYLLFSISTFLISFPVWACSKGETSSCSVIVSCIDKKIPHTVYMIVLTIQITVPILLVIFGMIDLVKAVSSGKEDEIKKAQNTLIKRLIAGVLVFFVIALVKLLINFTDGFGDNEKSMNKCLDCFLSDKCSGK